MKERKIKKREKYLITKYNLYTEGIRGLTKNNNILSPELSLPAGTKTSPSRDVSLPPTLATDRR